MAPAGAAAQATPPPEQVAAPQLTARTGELLAVLAGTGDYDAYFAPAFRTAVPRARFDALMAQLRESLGAPLRIAAAVPQGRWATLLTVAFERGTATMRLAVDLSPPHAVTGLLVTGTQLSADSPQAIVRDLAALPGTTQIGLYALAGGAPRPVLEANGDRPAPLGSAFKLWVLAELARQVAAGMHRWDEVVPVGPASLPSGILQTWPARTPMTLQALATLMISVSDNTATDTLIALLGPARVDATAARYGATAPVLTTREAFALKADPALAARWAGAAAPTKRALLTAQAGHIAARRLDPMMFAGAPLAIDTVEWFASPRDMARLIGDLAGGDPVVRAILAVNPGTDPGTAGRFDYVGFKGGSEPGVIALDYLVEAKDGRRYALSLGWHRTDGAVEEAKLVAIAMRALGLVAR